MMNEWLEVILCFNFSLLTCYICNINTNVIVFYYSICCIYHLNEGGFKQILTWSKLYCFSLLLPLHLSAVCYEGIEKCVLCNNTWKLAFIFRKKTQLIAYLRLTSFLFCLPCLLVFYYPPFFKFKFNFFFWVGGCFANLLPQANIKSVHP